ncbi:alpha/beta-hydrolase [Trametopsis cervina]|nr:alpha/beta-hydrolase [Trametopsis cervina]
MSEKPTQPERVPNAPSLPAHIFNQTLGFLVFFTLLLPVILYRTVLHISPKTRPHPSWTLRRSLAIAIGRLYLTCTTYLSLPREPGGSEWKTDDLVHRLAGKGTKVKMVRAPPVGEDWIISIATAGSGVVQAVDVPCFWTFVKDGKWEEGDERAEEGEKVIMYVNGGSWVMGHPQSTMFPYEFARITRRRVLAPNHRKALTPSTAFPAQLLDLLAGYAYLLSLGFVSHNIILVGDSSGGHLQLALSRYVAELGRVVPGLGVGMPGGLVLVSPSSDLSHPPISQRPTDYLVPYLNRRAYPSLTRHYAPSAVRTSPYFSPAVCGSFAYLACAQKEGRARMRQAQPHSHPQPPSQPHALSSPAAESETNAQEANNSDWLHSGLPIYIQYSPTENLHPDITRLITRMRGDGVRVRADEVEGGVHLDAGVAWALRERSGGGRGSWGRLVWGVGEVAA